MLSIVAAGWYRGRMLPSTRRRIEAIEADARAMGEAIRAVQEALRQPTDVTELGEALARLGERVDAQTLAIAEGIQRVERSERRVQQVVARARRQLEESGYSDPGLEATAHELRELDGDAGESGGVQPMFPGMGAPQAPPSVDWSAIPGSWDQDSIAAMHRLRGGG